MSFAQTSGGGNPGTQKWGRGTWIPLFRILEPALRLSTLSSDRGGDGLVRAHAASSRGCPNFMCFDFRLKLGRKERGGRTEDSECVSFSFRTPPHHNISLFQPSRPSRTAHPPLAEQYKGCQHSRLMRRLSYDCPRHRRYGMALRSQSTCGAWRSRRRYDLGECTPFAARARPWCTPWYCLCERCQWTKSFCSRR